MLSKTNLPTLLTLTRLVLSPVLLPVLIAHLAPYDLLPINLLLAIVFAVLSLTDFFDGYFARKLGQETQTGALLDPIADKMLTCSALIALLAADKIHFYWVIMLVCREFFVMGLRQMAQKKGVTLCVSYFGKLKTTVQMICLTFVIVNPQASRGFFEAFSWNGIQLLLLIAVTAMSFYSAYLYYCDYEVAFGAGGLGGEDGGV